MTAYLSVIVLLVGLFMYLYFSRKIPPPNPRNERLGEVGKIAYAIGLLAFLLAAGNMLIAVIALNGALSLGICILGFVVYLLSKSVQWSEVGRLTYAMGLLAFLIIWGTHTVSALPKS